MRLPVCVPCCRKALGKKSRKLCLLVLLLLVLPMVLLYSSSSIILGSRLIRRSTSFFTDEDKGGLLFAAYRDIDKDGVKQTSKGGQRVPPTAVPSTIIFPGEKLRVKETPFEEEKNTGKWGEIDHRLLARSPALHDNKEINAVPQRILQMVLNKTDAENSLKQPMLGPNGQKEFSGGQLFSQKGSHYGFRSAVSRNMSVSQDGSFNRFHMSNQQKAYRPVNADADEAIVSMKIGSMNKSLSPAESALKSHWTEQTIPSVGSKTSTSEESQRRTVKTKTQKISELENNIMSLGNSSKSLHLKQKLNELDAQTEATGSPPNLSFVENPETPSDSLSGEGHNYSSGEQRLSKKKSREAHRRQLSSGTLNSMNTSTSEAQALRNVQDLAPVSSAALLSQDESKSPTHRNRPAHRLNSPPNKIHATFEAEAAPKLVGLKTSEERKPESTDPGLNADELSEKSPKLNLTEWKSTQKFRKHLLRQKCEKLNPKRKSLYESQSIVDRKRGFLYCPVEKASSTFFHRFMFSLVQSNRSVEVASPFSVPIKEALEYDFETVRSLYRKGYNNVLDNRDRFIIVRDPFARLYSTYVDKLYVPNDHYWKEWGIEAITEHRGNPESQSLLCGHDVTFPEFAKYVINSLHGSDEHVQPVNALCSPCEVKFSVIGHVETLQADFEYLLSILEISVANFSAETFMSDFIIDAFRESTYSALESFENLRHCISKHDVVKRLWKKMQLGGLISDELQLPLTTKDSWRITADEFVEILQEAHRKSADSQKLHQQKLLAMRDAFEGIPAEDIIKLVKIYSLDFDLFGYDKYPSFIDIE